MYVIIWQYRVKPEHVAEFERNYGVDGPWIQLFKKSTAFLGTELLQDEADSLCFLTIDRWVSSQNYDSFLREWNDDYVALDAHCEELTEQEAFIGKWESILPEA